LDVKPVFDDVRTFYEFRKRLVNVYATLTESLLPVAGVDRIPGYIDPRPFRFTDPYVCKFLHEPRRLNVWTMNHFNSMWVDVAILLPDLDCRTAI